MLSLIRRSFNINKIVINCRLVKTNFSFFLKNWQYVFLILMKYQCCIEFDVLFTHILNNDVHISLNKVYIIWVRKIKNAGFIYIIVPEMLYSSNFSFFILIFGIGHQVYLVIVLLKIVAKPLYRIFGKIIIGIQVHNILSLSLINSEVSRIWNAFIFNMEHLYIIILLGILVA